MAVVVPQMPLNELDALTIQGALDKSFSPVSASSQAYDTLIHQNEEALVSSSHFTSKSFVENPRSQRTRRFAGISTQYG